MQVNHKTQALSSDISSMALLTSSSMKGSSIPVKHQVHMLGVKVVPIEVLGQGLASLPMTLAKCVWMVSSFNFE